MQLNRISASMIKTYNTCPRQFYFTYVLKMISIKSDALRIGSRYHELVEEYHNWQYINMDLLWVEYDCLRSYVKNPVEWNVVQTEVKERTRFQWVDYDISLILDRLDEDKIVEYKTSSFDYKEEDVRWIQTLIYVYHMYQKTWKIYPMVYSIVNKKKLHQKKYKPQQMTVILKEKELLETINIINKFVKNVENDIFPCKEWPQIWWCPYWPKGTGNCKWIMKWK